MAYSKWVLHSAGHAFHALHLAMPELVPLLRLGHPTPLYQILKRVQIF